MWSFAADDAAGHLCRFYASALGGFPSGCLERSGIPALTATAAGLVVLAVLARVIVSAVRAR